MISADFFAADGGVLSGFRVSGHSGYSEEGKDIVCAAVSAMAYLTANTITEVIGVNADIKTDDGFLSLKVNPGDENKCEIPLKGFYLQMKELVKQYPDYIRVREV
ncbi:MAG: ribosomal-processing cysteine protease Prp [Clostridiales bacterium]|nr:ribosomal-processing cysteine protease Prp [Clostridia bacterium]MCR4563355.1 ribosomal-processing cysteine protease Prp [Clostridiales bacterium]